MCPVRTLLAFTERTRTLREGLDPSHTTISESYHGYITLPLAPSNSSEFHQTSDGRSWNGYDQIYTSLLPVSSLDESCFQRCLCSRRQEPCKWSLNSTTFETYYVKPLNRESTTARIVTSIFPDYGEGYHIWKSERSQPRL
jgi:hypothetical protein